MSEPIYELLTLEGAARYYDVTMALGIRWMSQFGLDACLVGTRIWSRSLLAR
jgi:hypothetical protein